MTTDGMLHGSVDSFLKLVLFSTNIFGGSAFHFREAEELAKIRSYEKSRS